MLVGLSIVPLGRGDHLSRALAEIVKTFDESGLRYLLPRSGACIEGDWDEALALIKRCHERARAHPTF
jgi:uncharacterized protein YqgV (UPF0045/DUF77 family)